ncbi:MAG: asparagine synthase (glutamine-hydrolyzing) [Ferruginibacter sp.]|nr:asparagine synthase (glutamine-hydrolyzing) [Ferruginibacter sp.]
MCGIAGIISLNKSLINKRSLKTMSDALAHRGPDGEGLWINENDTAGFSHRRLAIIDLTDAAAQPMHYLKRYSIVYNGEIYNYKEIRSDLQKTGYHFTTESDTEVILAAFDFYKNDCVKYFDGMFSFAIWDDVTQTLFCARDIFGEKPFYYFIDKNVFVFASEMKALWAIGINKNIDEKMMVNYLAIGQVQNAANKSHTFYKNIFSLSSAHTGLFSLNDMHFTLTKYRDINKESCIKIAEKDAVEKMEMLLNKSVEYRLRSDVAVGSSLSGGLDSSTIAYLIQQQNIKKQAGDFKTFSAVFPGFDNDESIFIKALCEKFHLQNYTVTPTAEEMVNDFDKLCYHQEEPFTSSSIYAQYKVYELASANNIKVLLDGQGADEALAGYTKYLQWYLQELTGRAKFNLAKKERLHFKKNNIDFKWNLKNKIAAYLPAHTSMALEKRAYNKIINSNEINNALLNSIKGREWEGISKPVVTKLNDILYHNTMQHGLEELLRYADRNSMAHSTEVRLPFLNFELVKFIFSLPSSFKIKDGFTKSILRKTMQGKIPDNVLWNTKKIGFETPQKNWMENKKLEEKIISAKEMLVKEKILTPAVLNNRINAKHAHEAENMDWRYLNLAAFM